MEGKIPEIKISPSQVAEAFSATEGSNNRYTVSAQKEQLRDDSREESINRNCSELTEEQRKKFIVFCERWGGRVSLHIYRMLGDGRSEAEKTFTFNFIQDIDGLYNEILKADLEATENIPEDELVDLDQHRFSRITGGNNVDSAMFWTFAPYIFKNLPDEITKDRLRKILKWGLVKETSKEKIEKDGERGIHLKGVGEILKNVGEYYFLTINPNDLTHKFTDQEAKRLVEEGIFD